VNSVRRFDLQVFVRRASRLVRLSAREMLTTVHVVVVLLVVELLIRWTPLPRLSSLLGLRVDLAPAPAHAGQFDVADLPPSARRQLRCTHRVAEIWPFSKGPCLRRSLVAGHLLRDHGPAIRLGLIGSGDEVGAHAWLEIDGRPLESIDTYQAFQQASMSSTAAAPR
jgi:hypothetical protein